MLFVDRCHGCRDMVELRKRKQKKGMGNGRVGRKWCFGEKGKWSGSRNDAENLIGVVKSAIAKARKVMRELREKRWNKNIMYVVVWRIRIEDNDKIGIYLSGYQQDR